MFLERDLFNTIVTHAPLISIDLIVEDKQGCILLGQRLNRPAKNFWFVPGGRVYKNETLDEAFNRLTNIELGAVFNRSDAKLLGIYEHFYSDSVFGDGPDDPSTHYIVIAYHLRLNSHQDLMLTNIQHNQFSWIKLNSMLDDDFIHKYSKDYARTILGKQ